MKAKIFQSIEFVVMANFVVSAMFFIAGCFLSLSDRWSLFDFNQDLYGEFATHLKITMLYVGISEIIVCAYCCFTKKMQGFALAGFCMILMIGTTHFYGKMNDVEIDEDLLLFLFYTGISHILFGILADLKSTANHRSFQ